MKIALGMITKNEKFFLERHLSIIAPCFEYFIAIDAESDDGTVEILQSYGAEIFSRSWNNNFGEARSFCANKAEEKGYDWLFMLDADECMFKEGIEEAKLFMNNEENEFLLFPRIEFVGDTKHFNSKIFPDFQGRAIKLKLDYHWRGTIHEIVYKGNNPEAISKYTIVPNAMIFHYGWALDIERKYARYYPGQPIPDLLTNPILREYVGRQPV